MSWPVKDYCSTCRASFGGGDFFRVYPSSARQFFSHGELLHAGCPTRHPKYLPPPEECSLSVSVRTDSMSEREIVETKDSIEISHGVAITLWIFSHGIAFVTPKMVGIKTFYMSFDTAPVLKLSRVVEAVANKLGDMAPVSREEIWRQT